MDVSKIAAANVERLDTSWTPDYLMDATARVNTPRNPMNAK